MMPSKVEYDETRLSAGMIINNILVASQMGGMGDLFIKEGVIDAVAKVILDM